MQSYSPIGKKIKQNQLKDMPRYIKNKSNKHENNGEIEYHYFRTTQELFMDIYSNSHTQKLILKRPFVLHTTMH
jgi:hypothetical protein